MTASTSGARTSTLALAALGVVYGDIGTSPLYTMKEIFAGAHHPVPISLPNVLGMLSLILWSLLIVVSFKYVALIMRADNKGEGGIMALMALVLRSVGNSPYSRGLMLTGPVRRGAVLRRQRDHPGYLGVVGGGRARKVTTPALEPFVVPLTLGVSARFIRRAEAWHRQGGALVRADHGAVVCRARRAWRRQYHQIIRRCCWRSTRTSRSQFFIEQSEAGFSVDGRLRTGVDGRRSRCMRTWGTSAASPCSSPGSLLYCRVWC